MRKPTSVLLIAALASAFAAAELSSQEIAEDPPQETGPKLEISGEAKSGVYWQQVQKQGLPVVADGDTLKLHNTDDSGEGQGRFRLSLDYDNGKDFGMRARIEWENWSNTDSQQPLWTYAFGYGNFFRDQMTVSVGKLGASPWGTGDPDLWKELEQYPYGGGMRIEWKPRFIPEQYGKLNAGFVLSWFNAGSTAKDIRTVTLGDVFKESVIGVSYTHPLFMARFAYRLDSDYDFDAKNEIRTTDREGDEFLFRVEEHVLNGILPGMSVWALGYYIGVFTTPSKYFKNWLYAEYDPQEVGSLVTPFTAQIRFGFDYEDILIGKEEYIEVRRVFHATPSFYWHFFNKLLSVGALFTYQQDFGENKAWKGSRYHKIELEPKVQLNFLTSYIAFAYNWQKEYVGDYPERGSNDPVKQTQFINLRFGIYF